jgi:hypothetical protein
MHAECCVCSHSQQASKIVILPTPPAGTSGGSAISPEGWRFNICEDKERCTVDPTDGTSVWYRRMWQVRLAGAAGLAAQAAPGG